MQTYKYLGSLACFFMLTSCIWAQSAFESFTAKTPIVVRFQKEQKKLDQLKGEKAEKFKKQKFEQHMSYYKAFQDSFNLNPLFFMYAEHSVKLLKGQRKGIFLDDQLLESQTIELNTDTFLIADIGQMSSDRMGFDALFLRDQNLKYPEIPFPYYVKKSSAPFIGTLLNAITFGAVEKAMKSPGEVVEIFEQKLKRYLSTQ